MNLSPATILRYRSLNAQGATPHERESSLPEKQSTVAYLHYAN